MQKYGCFFHWYLKTMILKKSCNLRKTILSQDHNWWVVINDNERFLAIMPGWSGRQSAINNSYPHAHMPDPYLSCHSYKVPGLSSPSLLLGNYRWPLNYMCPCTHRFFYTVQYCRYYFLFLMTFLIPFFLWVLLDCIFYGYLLYCKNAVHNT